MEVGRILAHATTPITTHQVVNTSSTAKVVQDASVLRAEVSPSSSNYVGMSSLLVDALQDQEITLRNKVLFTLHRQMDIAKLNENVRLYRQQFRASGRTDETVEEFRRNARRFSRGSSAYELAMIEAIRADASLDHSLKFSDEFLHNYLRRYETELQAYLNISDVIEAHQGRIESEELSGAYEDILVQSQSLLQALGTIIRRIGPENIQTWVPFLTQSALADLVSQPVGADKVQLMFILQEMKSFRILNTMTAMLGEMEQRFLQQKKLSPSTYLLTSFEYAEQPIVTLNVIEKWISLASSQEQILFFQGYRQVFYKISEEAYQDEEQRRNALSVLQKKIDDLVYSEDE